MAELRWQFLEGKKGLHPLALEEYFQKVFFCNPWSDSSIGSLVYEEGRQVVGFQGIVPRPMSINGKLVQAAFGCCFVVRPENRGLAALQLLGAFLKGKQDLAITDTANRTSQQLWVGMGGSTSAAYGIQWARPLRPGLYALYVMSRFGKRGFSSVAGWACGVLSKTASAMSRRIPVGGARRLVGDVTEEELEIDTLLHSCLPCSFACYSLRPEYDRESLGWLLDLMSQMQALGILRKVALRDAKKEIIGWFIYYAKRGGIAEVVQIGAAKLHMKTVLDHLFCDARNRGAIAVHGRLEIRHAQELSEARCFFWGTVPLLFHARDRELGRLVQQGDAFLSRLDGEWCLRYGVVSHERARVPADLVGGEESRLQARGRFASNLPPSRPLQPKAVK